MLGLLAGFLINFVTCSTSPVLITEAMELDSDRISRYAIFSPDNSLAAGSASISIELLVLKEACSKELLQKLSVRFEPGGGRPVFISGHENASTFINTIEQVEAFSASNFSQSLAPIYVMLWPDYIEPDDAGNIMKTLSLEHGAQLDANSDVYVLFTCMEPRLTELWEIYAVGAGVITRQVTQTRGRVQPVLDVQGKISRRANFQKHVVRAIAENSTYADVDIKFINSSNGTAEVESGGSLDIIYHLRDTFNLSIQAMIGEWEYWLDFDGNITLLGIGGQLMKDSADIAITEAYLSRQRGKYLKFLHSTYREPLNAYFRNPESSDFRNILISSFSWDLWLSMVSVYLLLILVLKLFLWTAIHCVDAEKEDLLLNQDQELSRETLLLAVGIASQQGWHIQPESKSVRIVFLVGYLTGLICFVAYSAAIVSSLSVKFDFVQTFENFEGTDYEFLVDLNFNTLEWTRQVPVLKEVPLRNMTSTEAVRHTILSPKALFLSTDDEVYKVLRNHEYGGLNYTDSVICDNLKHVPVQGSMSMYGMFARKGSWLADFFNFGLLRQTEFGLLARLKLKYDQTARVRCNSEEVRPPQALGLLDVYTAFLVLVLGQGSSLVGLGCEVISSRTVFVGGRLRFLTQYNL